jgi:hypothetical protein
MENLTTNLREPHANQQHKISDTDVICAMIDRLVADQETTEALKKQVKTIRKVGQKRPESNQESDLEVKAETNREENTETVVPGRQWKIQPGHEGVTAPVNYNKDEIRAEIMALRSAQSKFEETMRNMLERTLASVDQRLQGLSGELHSQMEKVKMMVETTRIELKTQPAATETPARPRGGQKAATCVDSAGELMGIQSSETDYSRTQRLICWQCRGAERLMRDSRQISPQKDSPEVDGQRSEKQEEEDMKKKALGASPPPPRYTTSVSTREKESTLVIQGWIGHVPSLVSVDIGAPMTLASPHVTAGLPERNSRIGSLTTASGEIITITKEAYVNLTLGKYSIRIWVPVASIAEEFILGLDMLRAHNASVDFGRCVLCLGAEEVPLIIREAQMASHLTSY